MTFQSPRKGWAQRIAEERAKGNATEHPLGLPPISRKLAPLSLRARAVITTPAPYPRIINRTK